jgi:hypothetical protein
MKRFSSKLAVVGILVVLMIVSFSFSAQAAEKKKITQSLKSQRILSVTTLNPGDTPDHQLGQQVMKQVRTSSDPDWNDMEALIYLQWDAAAGSGSSRGYGTYHYTNGDESYVKFEGTSKMSVKEGGAWELSYQGKGQFTGGTGKFKNIKGGGTYQGKLTAEGPTEDFEFEVEY